VILKATSFDFQTKCQTRKGKRCTAPLFTESLPPICPDFSGLDTTPCKIPGVSKCKNNRDCKGSSYQTCCRYECGGICIGNYSWQSLVFHRKMF
jgi:hypothetical protein